MVALLRRRSQLLVAARILAVAALVPALLRLGLPRVESLLEPKSIPPKLASSEVERLLELVDTVLRRGRPLVREGCLIRGVTRYYFLRRAGVDVRLVFGLGASGDTFEGHCWLVRDGRPFLEASDPRTMFRETYSIPRQAGAAGA